MILNWFLLLLTAFIAYTTGSISTRRVASRYVFRRDLLKLGKGNVWLSNFRRLFGPLGFLKLGAVEIVKDLLPLLIGALLIGIRGRADIGRVFAGFCLMMGRLWPVFNRYRGGHGCIALILIGLLVDPSVGVSAALGVIAGIWFGKSLTLRGADTTSWREKTAAQETILDGGGVGTIVYIYGGTGRSSNFQHLTFTNGVAVSGKNGGGIYALGPTGGIITNCVFRNCSAWDGGGS